MSQPLGPIELPSMQKKKKNTIYKSKCNWSWHKDDKNVKVSHQGLLKIYLTVFQYRLLKVKGRYKKDPD